MRRTVSFLLLISVCLLIHEYGHFFALWLNGLAPESFNLGFGPKIISFRNGETEYALRLLLFGGYVVVKKGFLDSTPIAVQIWFYLAGIIFQTTFCILGAYAFDVLGPPEIRPWLEKRYGKKRSAVAAISLGFYFLFYLLLKIKQIKETSKQVVGPFGMLKYYGDKITKPKDWFTHLVVFSGILAGFNLLPLYPTDGGQIIMILLRTAGLETEYLEKVSSLLFLGAVWAIMSRDIVNLRKKH